jgi:hypothetical protein
MRNPSKSAVYVAATGSLALLLATSAFAEERHHDETRGSHQQGETRSWNRGDANHGNHQNEQQGSAPRTFDSGQTRSFDQNRDRSGQTRSFDRGQTRSFDQNQSRTFDQNRSRSFDQNQSRSFDQNRSRSFDQNRGQARSFDQNRGQARSFDQNRGQARSFDQNQARAWDRGNTRNYRNDSRSYNRGSDFRGSVRGGFRESYRNGIPRSDGRVSMLGRISRYEHGRGGYRIWVGGSLYPYWVPESYFLRHRIGIGLDLRLGGIFRDGSVYVDYLGWPGDAFYTDPYYYDAGYASGYANGYSASVGTYDDAGAYAGSAYSNEGLVSGTVDSVDYRAGTLYLRDDSSRRVITVDMRRVDGRNSRLDFGDLHPGDRVSLRGAWVDGNVFAAARIDAIDAN